VGLKTAVIHENEGLKTPIASTGFQPVPEGTRAGCLCSRKEESFAGHGMMVEGRTGSPFNARAGCPCYRFFCDALGLRTRKIKKKLESVFIEIQYAKHPQLQHHRPY
jgi:hypothetical protein